MWMIGRKKEQQILTDCLKSPRPEFITVYGRRRVGKTFLIRQFFNDRFSFYSTGIADGNTRDQLKVFNNALKEYGCPDRKIPTDWLEAFSRLKTILEKETVKRDASGKRIIFLDEVPWMDTARSDFRRALDYFWNSWGSVQQDLVLIVCGSATSWIINHLTDSHGGFYNRITRQIHLLPFTLQECEDLCKANNIILSRMQLMEAYMVFGGIPFYLNLLNSRLSLAQNIDELCYQENGPLRYESKRLFSSLFKNAEKHATIIRMMAEKRHGVTRKELAENSSIGNNDKLTKALSELEQCGFIRKYKSSASAKQGFLYQLIDPFMLYSLKFLENGELQSWIDFVGTPGYYAWRGNAFEVLCLNHIPQIKESLGIRAVGTLVYPWRSKFSSPGVQIDLLIDRKDGVINLCEMKCSNEVFVIDAQYEKQLSNKISVFQAETKTNKAIHLTMVTSNGLAYNEHAGNVINVISGDDLFENSNR